MIEPFRPLSESSLWDLVARFYKEHGLEVWHSGAVPSRITSNGYIADVYATIIGAFARDLRRQGVEAPPLILEVGGGSGLAAWLLVNRLLRHQGPGSPPDFQYLLTDTNPASVRALATVERLRRLSVDGPLRLGVLEIDGPAPATVTSLDGARFDLTSRPLALIANYVIDSLPADVLRIRDRGVFREFVSLEGELRAENGLPSLEGVETRFEAREVDLPLYGRRPLDDVVESYRDLPGGPCIPIPTAFAEFLGPLLESPAPLLMLAGDLAYTTTDFGSDVPVIHREYVTCTANFHLLGKLFEQRGGGTEFAAHSDTRFSVGAFIQPAAAGALPLTQEAARAVLRHFTPHDALNVERALAVSEAALDFRMVSGWLRLARCDAEITASCLPHLMRIVEERDAYDEVALRDLLFESYLCELPEVDGHGGFAPRIAVLFFRAGMYRATADLLDLVRAEAVLDEVCLHLRAVSAARLDDLESAGRYLEELEGREPRYWDAWPEPDRPLRAELLAERDDDAHVDQVMLWLCVAEFRRTVSPVADGEP